MPQSKQNAVKFGISNVHVAFRQESGYKDPIHLPGTVHLTTDPEGDTSTFYADNRSYYVTTSNKGYTGSIETAGFPDEVLAEALGQLIDKYGGIVETGQDRPNPFALGGEIDGDPLKRRFWFYNTTLGRTSMDAQTTEDNVEVATDTYDMTITGIDTDDWSDLIKYAVTSDAEIFEDFFDSVTMPTKGEYVPEKPATSLSLSEKAVEIAAPGTGSETVTATVEPSDSTDAVVAKSNDESVATATASGRTVTVTGKGVSGSCAVTVTCGEQAQSFAVAVKTA